MTSLFFLGSDREEGSRRSPKKSVKSTSKSSSNSTSRSSSRNSHRPNHLSDTEIKSLKRSSYSRLSDAEIKALKRSSSGSLSDAETKSLKRSSSSSLSDAEIKSLKRSSTDRLSIASAKSSGSPSPRRRPSSPLKLTLPPLPKHRPISPSLGSDSTFEMSSPTKTIAPETAAPVSAHKTAGLPMPGLSGTANGPIGNLLKGPVDANGKLKDAALMVGIKLDLEAEVHLTARVRGDILVGLY